ncbi:MAG: hypothetical protein EP344_02715 [Bacteroidetes bacterium]|nr:MAG: hypothetical protein EP344_02715 [Bacteroidota bacterium]
MKRINLTELSDLHDLSFVLDQALYLLGNSPVRFRASDLCRTTGVHASVLTRMKLLHVNSRYEPLVNRYGLVRLLKYLFEHFPTLVLAKTRDGRLAVRLYKYYNGYKLGTGPAVVPEVSLFQRPDPKPGSTRWYLEQANARLAP